MLVTQSGMVISATSTASSLTSVIVHVEEVDVNSKYSMPSASPKRATYSASSSVSVKV